MFLIVFMLQRLFAYAVVDRLMRILSSVQKMVNQND